MGDIWQAARSNNVGKVKLLLESGVSPNATRWVSTPLQHVQHKAFIRLCVFLLSTLITR